MQNISAIVYEFIEKYVPAEDIFRNEPMRNHTTFRIGGEAECLLRISSTEQLARLIPYFRQLGVDYFILGNGSNLLVGDKGYRGVILQLMDGFNRIEAEGDVITAGAGALMSQIGRRALEEGLTGFEFASGIPGTIGGGTVMNAGAYGGELKQVVQNVTIMSDTGDILELDNADMKFGYRTSIVKNRKFVILKVVLKLQPGNREEIKRVMEELKEKRKSKQPIEYPSAGSTFKRPEGYFAGKLIMDAGLRGYSVGGAQVSEKHCGFVINKGKASARDVMDVIEEVQERVKDRFGVTLEKEIICLGDF